MSEITRPTKAYFDSERQTTLLHFPEDDHDDYREYYVRGALCWPIVVGADSQGFALLGAQDVRTKIITVFEEQPFLTIDHVVDPETQMITHPGLSSWFKECWKSYFCKSHFWHQPPELHKRYLLQTVRSPMIEPKPSFIESKWDGEEEISQMLFEKLSTGKLIFKKGGDLHEQIQQVGYQTGVKLPAIHALQCLLWGMERYPWREPRV